MKSTLNIYILRSLFSPFIVVLAILLLALSMERMLRLIEQVTTYGAPFSNVFQLLSYLLPHYLGLALPAALFMAVMVAFRRLHTHAELDVLQASGVSLRRLLFPVFVFSGMITIFVLLLTSYAQPYSRYLFRDTLHSIEEAPFDFELQSGVFLKLGKSVTIRAEGIDKKSNSMRGFFAAVDLKDGSRSYFSAESAQLIENKETKELTILMNQGRQIIHTANGKARTLEFEQYPWTPNMNAMPYGPRGQDARELTLRELLVQKIHNFKDKTATRKLNAEFHGRLVHSLSLPFLALLAIPLALLGRGRTSRASGFVAGIAILILYEKILGFGEAYVINGALSASVALWLPFFLLVFGSTSFFIFKAEQR